MYCAYVTTIKTLRKHSNADRLQCTEVFGNNVIVDMNIKEGQKVIYFPVDGQLSEEFAENNNLVRKKDEKGNNIGGYLDPEKRNIKALKLRGEKSDGLVMPIEVLSPYVDVDILKNGDQITMLNGHVICRKYIPRGNQVIKKAKPVTGKKSSNTGDKYLFFKEHIDTAQLAYNESAFREGDTCYITLKMHGTSARTMNAIEVRTKKRNEFLKKVFRLKDKEERKYKLVTGTRRVVLKENMESDGFYNSAFRFKYHEYLKDKLPKGAEIFYEIVGWADRENLIMNKADNRLLKDEEFIRQYGEDTVFSYGCEQGENRCFVYRMTITNEDGFVVELPWEAVQDEVEQLGMQCVPTFEKFIYSTWDDLMERVMKYYDGPDPVGLTHIREGVVVRIDNRPSFTAFKHKNFNFKVLEGIIKENAAEPDMEEAEELIEDVIEDDIS